MAARAEAQGVDNQDMGREAHAGDIGHPGEAREPPPSRRQPDTIRATGSATPENADKGLPALIALVRLLALLAAREACDKREVRRGDLPDDAPAKVELP